MKLIVTMRVQGAHVAITCPQINYAKTVRNCVIVDATDDAIVEVGNGWDELGRHQEAANPTCREVVPFAVPVEDHPRIPLFILHYLREAQETYRPHRWWHVVWWLPDLRLEWPDYELLPQSDQETISANLRWLHLRQVNGRPPARGRRTPANWTTLALLVMLVGIILLALLR